MNYQYQISPKGYQVAAEITAEFRTTTKTLEQIASDRDLTVDEVKMLMLLINEGGVFEVDVELPVNE